MRLNTPIVRRSAAVLLPAACLIVAIVVLVNPAPQSAFAQAIGQFRRAQTIVCKVSMPEGLQMNGIRLFAEGKLMMSEQHGSTSSIFMNGMEVQRHYAKTGGPMIMVQPITKTWMTFDVSEIAFTETNEQTPDAFIRGLAKLRDGDSTELEKQEIDGHAALGYRIPGIKLGFVARKGVEDQAYAELWVDERTRLPARFLVSMPIPNAEQPLVMHYDQFEWDVPLPASVFEPNIPADFIKVEAKFTRPSEEALLNALRRLGELLGGKYPPQFDAVSVLGQVHAMVPEENRHMLDELGTKGIVQLGLEIGGGTMYFMQLAKDGHEPEYFGDEVTAADTDKPLIRWKLEDGRTRVIYGDLHVETLPAEK